MPAPIVVEVYAPQPRPQELAVLIAACSRAATPNECITSDVKTQEPPLGVAIVRRDGDRARIELGLRGHQNSEWSTRDLAFQPGDDELERYRAIGFAIGTLVAHQTEPPAPESKPAEPPPVPAAAPGPAPVLGPTIYEPLPAESAPPPRSRTQRATWIDLGGGVGLGLIPGPPRAGATLRAASELVPGGLFGVVSASYAERTSVADLSVHWLALAVGLGHPLAPNLRTLGVDVRLQFALEQLTVNATIGDLSQGDTRWKPGVSFGLDGHWDVAPPMSLVLSAQTFIDPVHTVVKTNRVQVGETPALDLSGFLGFRFRLR